MTTTAVRFKKRLSAEEWLRDLGDVPLHRICMDPLPGTATEDDAMALMASDTPCELVNGTLVEKVMGAPEGLLAGLIIYLLNCHVVPRRLGGVFAPDTPFRMKHSNLRLPDVSFSRRERTPNPIPQVGGWCPDLCIEILSPGNSRAEMALKRKEYFASGCQLVWEIDRRAKLATVYTSAVDPGTETDTLDGGTVLPGFTLSLAQLFSDFDAAMQEPSD